MIYIKGQLRQIEQQTRIWFRSSSQQEFSTPRMEE